MHRYGLIGYPLSHSFSRQYFTGKFEREGIADSVYELFPIEHIEELPDLIGRRPDLRGLNVTIPYKQAVLPYLDEVRDEARAVGAVNTIAIRGGRRIGYNTDVYGFEVSVRGFLGGHMPEAALVLGAGGAARAVCYVLERMGIAFRLVSREAGRGDLTYAGIDREVLARHSLIINTTPLGMAPRVDTCPELPYEDLSSGHRLYDLVYNPEKTLFLAKGAQRGCAGKNGLEMLYLQAERAWAIWNEPENIP